jgi:hypothetical protein
MKSIILGLTLLTSISSFAGNSCVDKELVNIDDQVAKFATEMTEKYGESAVNQGDLDAYREDLVIVARIKARTCLQIEKRSK